MGRVSDADSKNKIHGGGGEILRAESVQHEALFWKRKAAAEDHEKYDKSLTAVGDGETNQVERVIANVLGH